MSSVEWTRVIIDSHLWSLLNIHLFKKKNLCIVCHHVMCIILCVCICVYSIAQVQFVLVCFKFIVISNTATCSLIIILCVYQNFVQFLYSNVVDIHMQC